MQHTAGLKQPGQLLQHGGVVVNVLDHLQQQDLVCSAQGGVSVRDRDTRQVLALKQPLPQEAFRFHVKRTRQVVDDQQFCVTCKHARCRDTLNLATGQFHSARSDERIQSILQVRYIILEHRGVEDPVQVDRVLRNAQQNIIAQRFAR